MKNKTVTEIVGIQRLKYIVYANDVSKFRQWICKVFDLKPPTKIKFYMTAEVTNCETLKIGQILQTSLGIEFKVKNISKLGSVLRLESDLIPLGTHNYNLLLSPDKLKKCSASIQF